VKKIRFLYKSTCTTCRDALAYMRKLSGVELEARDYAKAPFSADELREIFKGCDPRDFLNPRSPAYKAMGLAERTLTPDDAIALMVNHSNLIKRPLVIVGKGKIERFDRDHMRALLE
jgi:arsenate reductase (glutaredoxin)